MIKESSTICSNCPMRRDSNHRGEEVGEDIALWYQSCFWPCWQLPVCEKQTEVICLGALIHVVNLYATLMLVPKFKELADQYEEDHKVIFSSNNEFIRYHRGEDFGSLAWYKRSFAYKYGEEQKAAEKENGVQGELF